MNSNPQEAAPEARSHNLTRLVILAALAASLSGCASFGRFHHRAGETVCHTSNWGGAGSTTRCRTYTEDE